MVKEFGNQFEELTLEYFKRVKQCPLVIRDYSFRKEGETKKGTKRKNPTDLDVVAISKDKIYAVTCQEWLPFSTNKLEIKKIVKNLRDGINDIKEKFGENKEIVPVISCVAIREENLKDIDEEVKNVLKRRAYVLFFLDMVRDFLKVDYTKESWIPAGDFDWFFSRLVGWFKFSLRKIFESKLEELVEKIRKRKYKIFLSEHIKDENLSYLTLLEKS